MTPTRVAKLVNSALMGWGCDRHGDASLLVHRLTTEACDEAYLAGQADAYDDAVQASRRSLRR